MARIWLELVKPRITVASTVTTAVGYVVFRGRFDPAMLPVLGCSSPEEVRYSRAWSSHRCSSCGLPSVNSVMWNVAGLSHFWHRIAAGPYVPFD